MSRMTGATLAQLDFTDLYVTTTSNVLMLDSTQGPAIASQISPWMPLDSLPHGNLLLEEAIAMVAKAAHSAGTLSSSVLHDGYLYRLTSLPLQQGRQLLVFSRGPREVMPIRSIGLPLAVENDLLAVGAPDQGGLVLVVGEMGGGKTTLINSLIRAWLERYGGVALSLEDPVEQRLEGAWGNGHCWQISVDDGDWQQPLQRLLRSRAKYHMISEIRTPETANTALRLGLIGSAVCSTIHGADVIQGITALDHYASAAAGAAAAHPSHLLSRGLRLALRVCRGFADDGRQIISVTEALVVSGPNEEAVRYKLARREFTGLRQHFIVPNKDTGPVLLGLRRTPPAVGG